MYIYINIKTKKSCINIQNMIYTIYIECISKILTGYHSNMSCCIISHFERFSCLTGLSNGDDVINRVSSWIASIDYVFGKKRSVNAQMCYSKWFCLQKKLHITNRNMLRTRQVVRDLDLS